ncbi:MAG: ABC transporter ATP-binding protein [Desulfobacterales bacterium]|nr:MAG: ABC transporter ATP-binding protein [Desulfobacterales bacterium]
MTLTIENLSKRFTTLRGGVDAVRNVSLEVASAEFFVLLGPSGCGKSTLLNLVAGLEKPTDGEIRFEDQTVAAPRKGVFQTPRQRNVAMVFQSYALYPHLNVYDNVAFPLRVVHAGKSDIDQAVKNTAAMLDIGNLMDRKPAELSGGQRQRVAIARALVRRPRLFLLDEPLSNLDAQLRSRTRVELKNLQQQLGITTLYVTHDQTEAMTLGSRIALLKDGSLVQVGTPEDMYTRPRTTFAATFIGSPPMNLISARIRRESGRVFAALGETPTKIELKKDMEPKGGSGREITVGIRPEHIHFSDAGSPSCLSGRIGAIEPLGREFLLHVRTDAGTILVLSADSRFKVGDTAEIGFQPDRIHLFFEGRSNENGI